MAISLRLNPLTTHFKTHQKFLQHKPINSIVSPIPNPSNPRLLTVKSVNDSSHHLPVTPENPRWERLLSNAATLYPVYVTVGGIVSWFRPSTFSWFVERGPTSYTLGLGFIMLVMGLTLELKDLVNLFLERPLSVTLIAQGDVALSVVMTVCTTLGAVILTPILTKILAGTYVPVDAIGLSISTLQAILSSEFGVVMLSVLLLHFAGFFVGYLCAAFGGFGEPQRRAISIEVGMQNSSLGVVLATSHFTSPLVALPPAMSAVIMNIMGSSLGFFWRFINPSNSTNTSKVAQE